MCDIKIQNQNSHNVEHQTRKQNKEKLKSQNKINGPFKSKASHISFSSKHKGDTIYM